MQVTDVSVFSSYINKQKDRDDINFNNPFYLNLSVNIRFQHVTNIKLLTRYFTFLYCVRNLMYISHLYRMSFGLSTF